MSDFAFAVDIMEYMNELNTNLQGKDIFAHDMHAKVGAFKRKLLLIYEGMRKEIVVICPHSNRQEFLVISWNTMRPSHNICIWNSQRDFETSIF